MPIFTNVLANKKVESDILSAKEKEQADFVKTRLSELKTMTQ